MTQQESQTKERTSYLWCEAYRPHTIDDCILPPRLKAYFKSIVAKKHLDNMTFIGGAGTGKTTTARALCDEMGIDHLVINASERGNIDTIRTDVRSFASTVSFLGGIKCIILDEADGLTAQAQQALRGAIEEFEGNCRFIFTGNFGNRIIEPITSRAPIVDFSIQKAERGPLMIEFAEKVEEVLKQNNVVYNLEEALAVIKKNFPDYRRTWNLLQRYSATGELKITSQLGIDEASLKQLVTLLSGKKFNDMRAWVVEHLNNDGAALRRSIYDKLVSSMEPASIPQLILILAEYDYKEAHVVDKEINAVAMLTTIMAECQWKS